MKKSQMLAALALTYVAGGVATPISGVFAESVQESCAPSADEAYVGLITGEDIDSMLTEIQKLPIYTAYHDLLILKTETYPIAKAQAIDAAVSDTTTAKSDAESDLATAQATVDAINQTDLANKIRQLSGTNYELDASATPESLVADAQDLIPHYSLYVDLINSIKDGKYNLTAVQEAVQALVAADAELNFDADAVAQADKWNVAKNAVVSDKQVYGKIVHIYTAEQTIAERDAQQDVVAMAAAALEEATAVRDGALTQIKSAFATMENIEGYTVTVSYNQAQTSVEGMVRYIKDDKISGYDQWVEFMSYVESTYGYANTDANTGLYTEIAAKVNTMLSATDAAQILNPTSNHKVCSIDGSVAVQGLLPDNKLVVKIEKVDNLTDAALAGLEQAVYDITIEHKGAAYQGLVGDYKVVINVPKDMKGETATVYYVNGNSREVMPSEFDVDNNTITFTTTHFSHYALVGESNTDTEFGGYDDDQQFTVDGPDAEFGGNDSTDADFAVDGPDEDFGGFGDDQGFDAPIISVGTEPIVKPAIPTVETPNTGVAAKTVTNSATATTGIMAGVIATASAMVAAVAMVIRRIRR